MRAEASAQAAGVPLPGATWRTVYWLWAVLPKGKEAKKGSVFCTATSPCEGRIGMKGIKLLTTFVMLVAFVMVLEVSADQAGVLGKLAEAAKAEKPVAAAASVKAAAAIVEKDVADLGDYSQAVGKSVAKRLKSLAESYASQDKQIALAATLVTWRVKDLYAALLPAAAGDMAAAAGYLKGKAAGTPDVLKKKIDAAVAALAGEDKVKAVKSMKVAIAAAYLGEAYKLAEQKKYREAGLWVTEVVEFLHAELAAAVERKEDLQDTVAMMRDTILDLSKNIPVEPEDISGLVGDIEHGFFGPKPKEE